MSLIKCSECGKEISDKATTCIHCGCPVDFQKNINTNIKEFEKLSKEEKNMLKDIMKKKGILYKPIDYILCFTGAVFVIIGFIFFPLWLLVPWFFIGTLGIQKNRIKEYYYNNPNCLK